MLRSMATVEQVVLQAGHIRVSLEVIEEIAAKLGVPELDAAVKAHHENLQAAWEMAVEHFDIPRPRSGGTDKPPKPV